jgi:hypothetical protein
MKFAIAIVAFALIMIGSSLSRWSAFNRWWHWHELECPWTDDHPLHMGWDDRYGDQKCPPLPRRSA